MERRHFLRVGAAAGAGTALASLSGCTSFGEGLVPPPAPASDADVRSFLGRLDKSMDAIATGDPFGHLFHPDVRKTDAYVKNDTLMRKTLRALLLSGSFHDLDEESRVHPEMQARMWRSMADMDAAMLGTTKLLDGLSPTERADLGRALRDEPELGISVIEALDREGAEAGVPLQRRLHMRSIGTQILFRMRQSTPLLVDEYVGKVQRVQARHGSNAELERALAARLGDAAFWATHDRVNAAVKHWSGAHATTTVVEAASFRSPDEPKPGTVPMTVGGVLLGLGVIAGVSGAIVLSTSSSSFGAGAVLVTVGAAVGLAGLITLIVGAVIRANAD